MKVYLQPIKSCSECPNLIITPLGDKVCLGDQQLVIKDIEEMPPQCPLDDV